MTTAAGGIRRPSNDHMEEVASIMALPIWTVRPPAVVRPVLNGDGRNAETVLLDAFRAQECHIREAGDRFHFVNCPVHGEYEGLRLEKLSREQVGLNVHDGCDHLEVLAAVGYSGAWDRPGTSETPEKPASASVAGWLAKAALERWAIRADPSGGIYGLPQTGPHIARPLRGGSHSLRAELARLYRVKHPGKVASQSALADALSSLEAEANDHEPVPMYLRVAEAEDALWLDLGDTSGRAVKVTPGGWSVEARPPVWFRRTELTGALPEPVPGIGDLGDRLAELWELVNITEQDRPLVLAVLVATLLPDIAHPVVDLVAEQGSGKSTAGRVLGGLLDPSPVPLRKPPRDEEGWVTAAAGSHVVVIDNVSRIPEWLSDSLCRAATGDGDVRRRLYTDADLSVFVFHRVVWLTGIELVGIRGDLADRSVMIELRRIDRRRLDEEIDRAWAEAHPRVLGAVLDLAAHVLAELPTISTADLPRMADFGRIVRAVDRVLGTAGAERYADAVEHLAADLAEGDPVAETIRQAVRQPVGPVTSGELLALIDRAWPPDRPRPREWPGTAKALTGHLTRIRPSLERLGWTVIKHERGGKAVTLRWSLVPPIEGADRDSA
jgi:hypothetical protein